MLERYRKHIEDFLLESLGETERLDELDDYVESFFESTNPQHQQATEKLGLIEPSELPCLDDSS